MASAPGEAARDSPDCTAVGVHSMFGLLAGCRARRENSAAVMRVIVCGSRKWRDRDRISDRMFDLSLATENLQCTVVHGNAAGADRIAAQEAPKIGLLVESHPANWEKFGKAAGPIRNQAMADMGADLCIAFWDGQSTGTKHMIDTAKAAGIPVEIIHM